MRPTGGVDPRPRRRLPRDGQSGVSLAADRPGHETRESGFFSLLFTYSCRLQLAITVALGFDTFVVLRHGVPPADRPAAAARLELGNAEAEISGCDLGCYFCNDVTAPGNPSCSILSISLCLFRQFDGRPHVGSKLHDQSGGRLVDCGRDRDRTARRSRPTRTRRSCSRPALGGGRELESLGRHSSSSAFTHFSSFVSFQSFRFVDS